jgi:hypothetical protein
MLSRFGRQGKAHVRAASLGGLTASRPRILPTVLPPVLPTCPARAFRSSVPVARSPMLLLGMAKYKGTVRRNDLEGGHWQLVTADGTTYVLEGDVAGQTWTDGARVEIDGAVDQGALSFAMTGPVLKVKAVKVI